MSNDVSSQAQVEQLRDLLKEASDYLPDVTVRKMFGCYTFFARGTIYALVWLPNRIGLKIPDKDRFEELMALPGAEPWVMGSSKTRHWVLVPETFHQEKEVLFEWVERAHRYAIAAGPKPKRARAGRTK